MHTVDWVIVETLCLKQGGYGGRTRYILKDVLKYIPLYGWQLGEVSGSLGEGGFRIATCVLCKAAPLMYTV